MEFHCLWLTTFSEFKLWKIALHSFPFSLVHHYYKDQSEASFPSLCDLISICTWSEKEFPTTPEKTRNYLKQFKKPSLLVVKKPQFAIKAFEHGFKNCIEQKNVNSQLVRIFIDLLAFYFKADQKVTFLKNKIWLLSDSDNNTMEFIPLNQTQYITKIKTKTLVKSVDRIIKTSFPFPWIWTQCQGNPLFCRVSSKLVLNSLYIESIISTKNNKFICTIRGDKTLLLNRSELKKLNRFL
jgi:hypothetical protein